MAGFSHRDPRCYAGIIITKKEVALALPDLGGDVSREVAKYLIFGNPPEQTAADILLTLSEAHLDRNENGEKWFDNVRISDIDTPYCEECGEITTDGLKP